MNGTNKFTAELAAQVMNVHLDRIAGDIVIPGIEFLFNELARQHTSDIAHQQLQQGELFWLQRQVVAVHRYGQTNGIERNVAMAQLAAALAVGATNQGLQTGGNFNQRERFTQIVIGAEAQPFNPLAERIAGREDQYRLVAALITPFAQDIQPSMPGSVRSRIAAS